MKISKAQRDEERRREAIKRNRLKHLLGLLLHVQVSWEHGFIGGGKAWGASYAPVELKGGRLGMAKILWAKLNTARINLFDAYNFHSEFQRSGKAFYQDGDKVITNLSLEIIKALPEEASYTDGLVVLTYLCHAFLHDLRILEDDNRIELLMLDKALASFANWLLPQDSPLVKPLNVVYAAQRDTVLCSPDWTRGGTLEWGESEQDKYEKEQRKKDGR